MLKKNMCRYTLLYYNAEKYIAETIYSVIENRIIKENKANLDYVICDGSSKDNTVFIAYISAFPYMEEVLYEFGHVYPVIDDSHPL